MKKTTKKLIFKFLENVVVKAALAKLLLSSTSLQGWLVSLLVEKAFDSVIVPLLNTTIRQGELFYDHQKGEIQIKRLENAEDNSDYDRRLRDVLQ